MAQRDYELPENLDAADRCVTLANEPGADRFHAWARAIMMYARARYNAFSGLTRDELAEQAPDETASRSAGEYRTVLRENLKERRPVYRAGDKDTPE